MKRDIVNSIFTAVLLLAILPTLAMAAPQVFIYTDKQSYQAGDTIEVSLSGENQGEAMNVDVYIGLLTPDGSVYTRGQQGWWWGIYPWIRDIYLPSQLNMERSPFFWLPLPCQMPPIHEPGQFSFLAGLTNPGALDFVSAIAVAPFDVLQVSLDYYVDAEFGDDANDGCQDAPWRTITRALNSVEGYAATAVTIHVAAGTYSASTSGESFPLNMKSWVSLVGEGADTTVLDAECAANHVIYSRETDGSIIEGFTITGGSKKAAPWPEHDGGGIRCDGGSSTIRHNTITGNSADRGGGICYDGRWPNSRGWPMISDNIISGNSAHAYYGGGGIFCRDAYQATIQNNAIESNSCSYHGGGIGCDHGYAVISGNTIRSNSAGSGGGGVYCYGMMSVLGNSITDNWASDGGGIDCDLGWAEISDNTISGNRAGSHGGAIYTFWTGDISVTNNQIVGNSSWSAGGGICSEYGGAISNNTIAENTTWGDGGGIWCGYASPSNNTIVGNVAGGLGGGIYSFESMGHCRTADSIIWDNGDDLCNCDARHCCVQDPDRGEGNIHADPMFTDGPYGEYYLHPDSPCIDAGSRSSEDAGLSDMTTQRDGTPDTGTVDMGRHYRIPATQRPVAHIDSISPNPATQGVDTVEFIGQGTDDVRIARYEWRSNLDGLLSDEQAFFVLHAAYLTLGTHTISFSVWDDEHQQSGRAVLELTILPCPFEDVYVDAQSGHDSNYGSEMSPFKTIAHALGCVHGTQEKPVTVHVAAGAYSASSNGECFPLDMKSWVSVIGQGADTTKLDAEGRAYHVITCQSVDYLWIAGFTIEGGHADGFKDDDGDGGAILCNNSSPTIWGNTIMGNRAYSAGGISCYDSSPTISNNTIVGNVVPWGDGGGIGCYGGSSPTIQGNTIADNFAGYGRGISCYYSSPTITDCIVWNGGDDLYNCTAKFCCIEGPEEGEGNIHDAPMFTDGPYGDYYLGPDSACIDAGSRSAEDAGLSGMTTQEDGTPDTGTVDMGCHYPIP